MNAGRRTQPDLQSPRIDRIINPEVYPTRDERVHLAAVGARRKRPVSSVVPNSQSQDSTGDVIQGQGEGCLDVVGWYLNCNATNVDPGNILEGTWSLLVPRCQPRVAPVESSAHALGQRSEENSHASLHFLVFISLLFPICYFVGRRKKAGNP